MYYAHNRETFGENVIKYQDIKARQNCKILAHTNKIEVVMWRAVVKYYYKHTK